MTATEEMIKALNCLYIAVKPDIASDIAVKVQAAMAEKYKRIEELESNLAEWIKEAEQRGHDRAILTHRIEELQKSFDMSGDARKEWMAEFDGYKKRIEEARRLIEKLGTVAHDSMDVLTAAEKWLEGKP